MSESSAKSANTNLSVFSTSGTASEDQTNEAAIMMASGMSADDTLNVLLQRNSSLAGGSTTTGGRLTAGNTLLPGGSPAAITGGQPGSSRAAVPAAPPGIPQALAPPETPDAIMSEPLNTVSRLPTSNKMAAASSPRGRGLTSDRQAGTTRSLQLLPRLKPN